MMLYKETSIVTTILVLLASCLAEDAEIYSTPVGISVDWHLVTKDSGDHCLIYSVTNSSKSSKKIFLSWFYDSNNMLLFRDAEGKEIGNLSTLPSKEFEEYAVALPPGLALQLWGKLPTCDVTIDPHLSGVFTLTHRVFEDLKMELDLSNQKLKPVASKSVEQADDPASGKQKE